jgi:hypothetical protein
MSRSIRTKLQRAFDPQNEPPVESSAAYDDQRALWEPACFRLWGADYGVPLAEALGISDRTVRYWRSGRSRVNPDIIETLSRLNDFLQELPYHEVKAIGKALRRLGQGETFDQLKERIQADKRAVEFLIWKGHALQAFPPFEQRE